MRLRPKNTENNGFKSTKFYYLNVTKKTELFSFNFQIFYLLLWCTMWISRSITIGFLLYVNDKYSPEANIKLGCKIIRKLLNYLHSIHISAWYKEKDLDFDQKKILVWSPNLYSLTRVYKHSITFALSLEREGEWERFIYRALSKVLNFSTSQFHFL